MYTKEPKYLIDTEALKQAIFEKGYSVRDFCKKVARVHATSVYPRHGELFRETSQWLVERLSKGLNMTVEEFMGKFGASEDATQKLHRRDFGRKPIATYKPTQKVEADKHGEVSIGSTVDTKQLIDAIKNTIVALQVYETRDQNLYVLANGLRKVLLGF